MSLNVHGLERPLSAAPEFAARIKRLAALRHKTADFTVHGRFRDQVGLTVAKTGTAVAAYLFESGKLGLTVGEVADKEKGGGKVSFTLDLGQYGRTAPAKVLLHREDGTTKALPARRRGRKIRFSFALRRWECAVVEV